MTFTHEAILETLDWTQYDPFRNEFDYYSVPEFEKNVKTFDNISIYFGKKHPGIYPTEEDLLRSEDVIKVGYTSNPEINMMGRPKLKSLLHITDSTVEDKIRKGEIKISPFFRYNGQKNGYKTTITNPRGLHVLLFDKNVGGQGDPGAIICNQDNENSEFLRYSEGYFLGDLKMANEPPMQVVEVSSLIDLIKANTAPALTETVLKERDDLFKANQALTSEKDELIKANQALEVEKEDLIKANQDLTAELETSNKKYTDFKAEVEAEKVELFKANQDRFWSELGEPVQEAFADRKEELYDLVKANQLFQDITRFVTSIPKPKFMKAQGSKEVKIVTKEDETKMQNAETMRKLASHKKNINYAVE